MLYPTDAPEGGWPRGCWHYDARVVVGEEDVVDGEVVVLHGELLAVVVVREREGGPRLEAGHRQHVRQAVPVQVRGVDR